MAGAARPRASAARVARARREHPIEPIRDSTRASSTIRPRSWRSSSSRRSTAPGASSALSNGSSRFGFTPFFTNATLISVGGVILAAASRRPAPTSIAAGRPLARPFVWPGDYGARPNRCGRLLAQVPADAAVSATSAVHPHLAHREKIYVYPEMGDATYALIDVAGVNGHAGRRRRGLRRAAACRRVRRGRCGRRLHPPCERRGERRVAARFLHLRPRVKPRSRRFPSRRSSAPRFACAATTSSTTRATGSHASASTST